LALSRKGRSPDLLAMTATPIPRTLMLTAYGDLECSYLREKPAHRQPVETRILSVDRLDELVKSLVNPLKKGDKIYWVCPLVEESEALEIAAAEDRYESLKADLPKAKVGLVHGRLSAHEKNEAMEAFRQGALDILVATTVIEVGVDVQDATIMIIEQAERFGLAQLHQLRGRIGRGDKPGTCLLLYGKESGYVARQRLQVLKKSHDGFYIAEQDWKLRGGGEALGARQSGAQAFRFIDMAAHHSLLELAHQEAESLLTTDPLLKTEQGQSVRFLLHLFLKEKAMSYLEAA
jgi:ATP-dependent DNA helicase RecG